MPDSNPNVVHVGQVQITGASDVPPPGRYLSITLDAGTACTRVYLTEGQAAVLAQWLLPPEPPDPPYCPATGRPRKAYRPATSFPAVAVTADGASQPTRRAGKAKGSVERDESPLVDADPLVGSGDKLVTGRFVTGLRERHAALSTEELALELATFEPDLARMAGRLIRGTVAGHLGPNLVDRSTREAVADACLRETLLLLVALRGQYADLLGDLFDQGDAGNESSPG